MTYILEVRKTVAWNYFSSAVNEISPQTKILIKDENLKFCGLCYTQQMER